MSLIAEALRTAQREREGRQAELSRRAQTLLRPGTLGWAAPLPPTGQRRGTGWLLMLGVSAIAGLSLVLFFAPSRDRTGSEAVAQTRARTSPVSKQSVEASGAAAPENRLVEPATPEQGWQPKSSNLPGEAPVASEPKAKSPGESSQPPIAVVTETGMTARSHPAGSERSGRLLVSAPRDHNGSLFDRLFQEGLSLHRSGRYRAALHLYEQALAFDPQDPRLWNNIGAVRRALGEFQPAREALTRAIELDPRYSAAWVNLGVVLEALGERQEAALAFQTALGLDPGNPSASVNLAIQYHQAGLWEEAQRLLEEALRRDPLMPEAHYELGRLSEARGDRDKATLHYRRFLELGAARFPEIATQVRARLDRLSP